MTTPLVDVINSAPDREIVACVGTHSDTHHVAVLGITGTRLGDLQVPATSAGYEQLLGYIRSLGSVRLVGIEGTSSYGAGLSRYLRTHNVEIREIIRPRRSQRRRGKSDPIDAYATAQQTLDSRSPCPPAAGRVGGVVDREASAPQESR